jgi:hypothetical protein
MFPLVAAPDAIRVWDATTSTVTNVGHMWARHMVQWAAAGVVSALTTSSTELVAMTALAYLSYVYYI